MEEEIVASDTYDQHPALFVHKTTMHEASQTEQSSHLLENTSTLARDYIALPTHEPTSLPSLTFNHHYTPYTPVISNIDIMHGTCNHDKLNSLSLHQSSNSTSTGINLDWTDTGFAIHRLKESS